MVNTDRYIFFNALPCRFNRLRSTQNHFHSSQQVIRQREEKARKRTNVGEIE